MTGTEPHLREIISPQQDSAIAIYYQASKKGEPASAKALLLSYLLSPAVFNELRSEQADGYVVSTEANFRGTVPGIVISIQSPAKSAEQLERDITSFLRTYESVFDQLTDEEIGPLKDSIVNSINQPNASIHDGNEQAWNEIMNQRYDFDVMQRFAAGLSETTADDLKALYQELFLSAPGNQLVVRVKGTRATPPVAHATEPIQYIEYESAAEIRKAVPAF